MLISSRAKHCFAVLGCFVSLFLSADKNASLQADLPPQQSVNSEKKVSKSFFVPYVDTATKPSGLLLSSNIGYSYLLFENSMLFQSPMYEVCLGYRFFGNFKVMGSYQHQQGHVEAKMSQTTQIGARFTQYELKKAMTDLHLHALAVKIIAAPKNALHWLVFQAFPYFSFGAGYGLVDLKQFNQTQSKLYMVEGGLNLGASLLYVSLGCKFNCWSLENRLYSIAPYLGVQLSF